MYYSFDRRRKNKKIKLLFRAERACASRSYLRLHGRNPTESTDSQNQNNRCINKENSYKVENTSFTKKGNSLSFPIDSYTLFIPVHFLFLYILISLYQFSSISIPLYQFLSLFINFSLYPSISLSVQQFLSLSNNFSIHQFSSFNSPLYQFSLHQFPSLLISLCHPHYINSPPPSLLICTPSSLAFEILPDFNIFFTEFKELRRI